MISKLKQLRIANCMYANVAGLFATFSNEKYRGPNFDWENFPDMVCNHADLWWKIHEYNFSKSKTKDLELDMAKTYAKDIAQTLLERMK